SVADSLSRIRNEPKSVVSGLAKALKDPDEKVRRRAAGALTTFGRHTREIIPSLVEPLKSRDGFVSKCVLSCLRWHVDDAVLPVCEALLDPKASGAWRHAEFLGELGPGAKKAIPALLLFVKDEQPWVRWKTAEALVRIEPGLASNVLPTLIRSLDYDVTK